MNRLKDAVGSCSFWIPTFSSNTLTNSSSGRPPQTHIVPHRAIVLTLAYLGQRIPDSCCRQLASFTLGTDHQRCSLVTASRDTIVFIENTVGSLHVERKIGTSTNGEVTGLVTTVDAVVICSGLGIASYNLNTSQLSTSYTERGHAYTVLCIAVSPNGQYIATGGSDATIVIWTVDDGPLRYLAGHHDWVRFVKFCVCGVGQLALISASDDGTVMLWDPLVGSNVASLDLGSGQGIHVLETAQGSNFAAVASESPIIYLYRTSLSQPYFAPAGEIKNTHCGTLSALCIDDHCQYIASSGEDETICLSCIRTLTPLFRCSDLVTKRRCVSFMTTVSSLCFVAAPPLSSVVVVGACASDGVVLIWVVDPRDGRCFVSKVQSNVGGLVSVDS